MAQLSVGSEVRLGGIETLWAFPEAFLGTGTGSLSGSRVPGESYRCHLATLRHTVRGSSVLDNGSGGGRRTVTLLLLLPCARACNSSGGLL